MLGISAMISKAAGLCWETVHLHHQSNGFMAENQQIRRNNQKQLAAISRQEAANYLKKSGACFGDGFFIFGCVKEFVDNCISTATCPGFQFIKIIEKDMLVLSCLFPVYSKKIKVYF